MENKRKIINKKLATGVLISSLALSALGCAKKDEERPVETVVVYETVVVTATPEPTKVPTNTQKTYPTLEYYRRTVSLE